MQIQKTASAQWKGDLKGGGGVVSTESGALHRAPYGFQTRFEDTPGTNPEELIAAAHAACFAMALTAELGKQGIVPDSITTIGKVTLEKQGESLVITRSDIELMIEVGDASRASVRQAIETTRHNCPVSKLLNAARDVKVEGL